MDLTKVRLETCLFIVSCLQIPSRVALDCFWNRIRACIISCFYMLSWSSEVVSDFHFKLLAALSFL